MIRTGLVTGILAVVAALTVAAGSGFANPACCGSRGKSALTCPVMKSPIKDKSKALAVQVNNTPVYVCCAGCPDKLKADPAKYLTSAVKDPVTSKSFRVTAATPKVEQNGALYLFASAESKATFMQNPARYSRP